MSKLLMSLLLLQKCCVDVVVAVSAVEAVVLPVNYQKADEQRLLVVWSSKEDTKQRPIRRGSPCSAGL